MSSSSFPNFQSAGFWLPLTWEGLMANKKIRYLVRMDMALVAGGWMVARVAAVLTACHMRTSL